MVNCLAKETCLTSKKNTLIKNCPLIYSKILVNRTAKEYNLYYEKKKIKNLFSYDYELLHLSSPKFTQYCTIPTYISKQIVNKIK